MAVLAVAGLLLSACDWTMFRYMAAHTGFNNTESAISVGNVSGLTERFTAVTGAGVTSPSVARGKVYVGSGDNNVYAFDAVGAANCSGSPRTCQPLWTATTDGPVGSAPAVVNGVVYVGSSDNNVYAFDAAGATNCSGSPRTCQPLWTAATNSAVASSPAVVNGVVYIGSEDGQLYAFDAAGATNCSGTPKTCQPLWTANAGDDGPILASPAVANGVVYVGSYFEGNLFAFDAAGATNCSGTPKTCQPLWTAPTASRPFGSMFSSPAVANGVVYVGSGDNKLYAFDAAGAANCSGSPKTCQPLWTAATSDFVGSSPAVANGVVYVGSNDHHLYAFDAAGVTNCSGSPKTCTPLWTAATSEIVISSPAVANGVVYVGSNDGNLYAFDAAGVTNCLGSPKTCTPLFTTATTNGGVGSPAVANGIVYFGSGDHKLYAYALP